MLARRMIHLSALPPKKKDPKLVNMLIAAGANPNQIGRFETPPLITAIRNEDVESLNALLSAKANPNKTDARGYSPLTVAIGLKSEPMVTALIKAQADVNAKDITGDAPLIAATKLQSEAIINQLIAAKADVNIRADSFGLTPLMIAASANQIDIVRGLLTAHANPNLKDVFGLTILDRLEPSAPADSELIKLLKQHGARHASTQSPSRPNQPDPRAPNS